MDNLKQAWKYGQTIAWIFWSVRSDQIIILNMMKMSDTDEGTMHKNESDFEKEDLFWGRERHRG